MSQRKDIEIDDDYDFQQTTWVVERAGWAVLGIFLNAAILGLFGPGLFNKVTSGSAGETFWIEHGRFARYLTPTSFNIFISEEAATGGEVRVHISEAYIDNFEITQIHPQPESVATAPDGLVYTFLVAAPADFSVRFDVRPERVGRLSASIWLEGEDPIEFWQFVYP